MVSPPEACSSYNKTYLCRFDHGGPDGYPCKPKNRALFLVSVAATGAFAGTAVWLFFFAMERGIDYLWTEIPHMLGVASPELASGPFGFLPYPFFVCLLGGLLIGLYER